MNLNRLNKMLFALLLVLTFGISNAQAGLLDVGPVVSQVLGSSEGTFERGDPPLGHGFPLWYRDTNRMPLELCLDRAGGQCATFEPTPGAALRFPDPENNVVGNFSDEAFWWSADASIAEGGVEADLVMAIEAAFSTGDVAPGAQVSFARIRIRVDGLPSPGIYTVTTPYKQYSFTVVTDPDKNENAINFTEDLGIAEGGIFTGALNGSIDPFLYCVGAPFDIDGAKYLAPSGGVCLNGAMGGSYPTKGLGTYTFSVVGPGVNISTGQFTIIGKIYSGDIPTPLAVDKASYARNADGVRTSVFASTQAMSNQKVGGLNFPGQYALAGIPSALQLTGTDIPTINLATNNPADGEFYAASELFASPVSMPASVTVTNTADVPLTTKVVPLVDEVVITESSYAPATKTLKVAAESLDKVDLPALEVFMSDDTVLPDKRVSLGTMGSGLLSVTFPATISGKVYNIPPSTVSVISSAGGSSYSPVNMFNATPATMTSPVNGSTLTSTSQTFTWLNTGASSYGLDIGTTVGGTNIRSANTGTATTLTVTNLPTNATTVYVRLWSKIGTVWSYNDYTYTASGVAPATMTSPATPFTFPGASYTFSWTNPGAAAYGLDIGTTVGAKNITSVNTGTASTYTVTNLPINGSTVYVRLWSKIGATWYFNDYTYTASGNPPAVMTSPAATPFTFTGPSYTFNWTNTGAASYGLDVGTTVGGTNIRSANTANATTLTVVNLPVNGSNVYVRLWSKIGATWYFNDYVYKAFGP